MMDPSSSSSAAVPAAAPAVGDGGGGGGGGPAAAVSSAVATASRRFQHLLDRSTPHVGRRWLAFAGVAAAYALRVWFAGGYYIVTYALGIYILNLLIAFLSPQVDPEVAEVLGEGGAALPTRASDEFRPFVRRLPEFKFWFDLIRRNPLPSCNPTRTRIVGSLFFILETGVYGGLRELGACGKIDGEG
uniref:Protein RER1 n=1 Tax=Oryza punctata TaxID=4537 RepID=A0A0E0LTM7_ORYPU